MTTFDDFIAESASVPIVSWDFSWLDGRAIEERPSWRYFDRVRERISGVSSLLEIQAGTGTMIGALPSLPVLSVATEGFPPSVRVAASRLKARGVHLVVTSQSRIGLPLVTESFELVISRHPIDPWWREIARVLRPGGSYFAQHVGPHSLGSLSEFLMGSVPETSKRHPDYERQAATEAGLIFRSLTVERPRIVFFDVGAVVYFLRLVPWTVPDFTVDKYQAALRRLHDVIERDGRFETTASRMLIDATKPIRGAT
jgi:SAM-dependent methyltransferase